MLTGAKERLKDHWFVLREIKDEKDLAQACIRLIRGGVMIERALEVPDPSNIIQMRAFNKVYKTADL